MQSVLCFSCGVLFLITGVAYTQDTRQAASGPQHPDKVTLTECEDGDNCGTWTFWWASGKGFGTWRNGDEAQLEIEVPEKDKVVIRRFNTKGANEGLAVTYHGTLSSHQLGGTYIYDNAKSGDSPRFWNAAVAAAPPSRPSVMHWCAIGFNCFTLNWENGHYVAIDNGHAHGSTWTVENFTRESVRMLRAEPNGATAIVTGQISNAGDSLVNGKSAWTSDPNQVYPCIAAWGTALNTVPGSNAELAAAGGWQRTKISNDVVTDIAVQVAKGVVVDVLKDWIESKIHNNQ